MLKQNIYIGTICKNNNGEKQIYQTLSPLLKLDDSSYVAIEWVNSLKSYLEFYKSLLLKKNSNLIIKTTPENDNDIYVDEDSLVPYYENDKQESISLSKYREEFLLDARIPRGIDYGEVTKIYIRQKNPRIKTKQLKKNT